jgi:hypothetical protein
VPRPLRRPPAISLDDDEEEEPEGGDGSEDEEPKEDDEDIDVDQEGDENEDLQELDGGSLKQKMASEVCNLLKLRINSELHLASSVVQY